MGTALESVFKWMRQGRDATLARDVRINLIQTKLSEEADRKGLDLELTQSELEALVQSAQQSVPELYALLRDQAEVKDRAAISDERADD